MVLVSSDDRPRTRVGPKVFADVPSAAEIGELKRSRSQVLVFCFLLLGLLIAASIAAFALWGQVSSGDTETAAATQTLREERDAATQALATYRAQVAREYGQFETIVTRNDTVTDLRTRIQAALDAEPRARRLLPRNSVFLEHQEVGGTWSGLKTLAENRLLEESRALTSELALIGSYTAPTIPTTPSTPSTPGTP